MSTERKTAKRSGSSVGTPGGGALMVIFAVLCLTVFSILSLSTVLADKKLSDKYEQGITDYYLADAEAQGIIAQLRAGDVPESVVYEEGVYSFACPVSDTRELRVKVMIDGNDYTVLSSRTVYCGDWNADNGLGVWSGN